MQTVLEEIVSGISHVITICINTTFHIWIFDVSLFDLFITLMLVEFILSVIFPYFSSEDED